MGRVNPQPQASGAAASSSAAAPATAPAGDPQDQEASASPEGVVGTAPSAETTGQEFGEAVQPPLTPRVASGISSSQPTFTPQGSETAEAEEVDNPQREEPVAEPTTIELPPETSTLGSLDDEAPLVEAELQTGTAASRGEVSPAQDGTLGPANADEPSFDVFSLLGPPKIEPTAKEEVEEEVYADPSTSPVGLPPLHTHNHPTQFESLATDPVFDEAEVDFGDEEPGDDPDDQVEPAPKEEQQEGDEADDETAPSAETSQTASAAVDPQPKRTRGARGGQKHQFEQSDKKYALTCDLIASHLASHTYRRVRKTYHLPFVKPLIARRDYSEWYKYVVFHADAWAESPEDGDISDGALKAWAAIIPEFWSWCTRHMPDISNGVKQPTYRFPPGYYQKTYKFIPLRQVHSSTATSSQAAPAAQQTFPVTVPARTFQPVVGASAASQSGGWRPQLRPVDHPVQPRSQTPQGTPRSRSQTRTSEPVRPPRPTRPCPRPNRETAELLADTEQPTRTVHLADEQADDPMDGVGTEEGAPAPEAEVDPGYPEGAEEEGTVRQDGRGGTALAREEEEAFEPDPVVEVEGEDLEAVRTRAANTITRAVRSGRLGRALAAATPPNPPPLDPEYPNIPHRPQTLPPHVKVRRPPPPKASNRSLPVSAQPPAADAPIPEPNQPRVAPQPRQRGFVRLQHAAREPPAQPIPMDTARDTVYDLPDHVWRTRPTREPGGLTVPHSELLVHPNTEVHAMDVDDEESPPPPAAKPRATAPWRRAPTYALEAEEAPEAPAPKPRTSVNPPPPKRSRVVFATTSRVVLRPGPGAPEETAPSAEPSFAEHTRGTVPLVAQRIVTGHSSGEPPAQSPSRTSVTVTPLVDPMHRTPNRNWADQSADDDLDDAHTDSGAAPSGSSRSRTPPPKPLVVKPPPQCIREDPSQRKPQYVESGRVEEFLPHGFFTTPPPGPPKPPPPPPPAQVPKPKPMPERPPRSSSPAPANVAQDAAGRGRGHGYPAPPAPSATAPRAEEDPAEAEPKGGTLAPPTFGDPPPPNPPQQDDDMPLPRNRYLELWQEAHHVFGQQMCDPMTLTLPGQAHNIEVGLDFHKVLDAMLVYKLEVPTRQCVDALANLERLGARITIISFTGHEGYARAASQTAHFRDCVRAAGLQMGGGIFLTNSRVGPEGKTPIVTRLGICAYVDDDSEIINEVRRTGCYGYLCDATRLNQPHSVLLDLANMIRSSGIHNWKIAHHPRPLASDEFSGESNPRGGGRRRPKAR